MPNVLILICNSDRCFIIRKLKAQRFNDRFRPWAYRYLSCFQRSERATIPWVGPNKMPAVKGNKTLAHYVTGTTLKLRCSNIVATAQLRMGVCAPARTALDRIKCHLPCKLDRKTSWKESSRPVRFRTMHNRSRILQTRTDIACRENVNTHPTEGQSSQYRAVN